MNQSPSERILLPAGALKPSNRVLALCSVLGSFLPPPMGLVLGVIALKRIKNLETSGRNMAIVGILLSSTWIAALIVLTVIHTFSTSDLPSVQRIGWG